MWVVLAGRERAHHKPLSSVVDRGGSVIDRGGSVNRGGSINRRSIHHVVDLGGILLESHGGAAWWRQRTWAVGLFVGA
jgi:hypothetical protein